MNRLLSLGLSVALFSAAQVSALPAGFHQKDLITGLDAVSSAILPDGRILAIEKYGKVTLIKNGVKQNTPFLNWEKNTISRYEKGMMTILADPNFATNGYIYVWYSNGRVGANGQDQVSRFTVVGDTVDTNSEKLIISLGDSGKNYHHGSGLQIEDDGKLYIASGCRGDVNDGPPGPANAANKNTVEGKILRVNLDGTIPTDNPFYTTNTGDARAVYYWGLRNPFTMSWNAKTKVLWFSEVQSSSADDKVEQGGPAGTDYGFQNRGGQAPLWQWTQVNDYGRAMVGSLWYNGTNFPAEWQGTYFFGNVEGASLYNYGPTHTGAPRKFSDFQCPIDVKADAAGAIYVSTRCQTEDVRYTTGKVTKVWYGDTEPVSNFTPEKQSSYEAASRMRWAVVQGGHLQVTLQQDGPQSVELRSLSGKLLAKQDVNGKVVAELEAPSAKGTQLLVWRSGSAQAVTKVVLD